MKLPVLALAAAVFAAPLSAQAGELIKKKWYDSEGKVVEQWVYSGKDSKRDYQLAARSHRARPYRGHSRYPLAYRSSYTIYPGGVYYSGGSRYYSCGSSRPVVYYHRAPISYHGTQTSVTVLRSSRPIARGRR